MSAALACLERGSARLRAAADAARDADGDESSAADIQAAVAMIHRMLAGDPSPAPQADTTQLLATFPRLRTAYLRELEQVSDASVLHEAITILETMDRAADAVEHDPAYGFTRRIASAQPLNPVVAIAHDMRSPLTSILFLVDSVLHGRSGELTPARERQLALVYNAAFGLSTMVNDVLLLARADRLRDPRPHALSLSELVRSVQRIVLPIAEEKGLQVIVTLPAGDVRLGHALALSRVLLNLVTNALKFTRAGTVSVAARDVGEGMVAFVVEDTGDGVPAEVLKSLFDPFRPVSTGGRGRPQVFSSAGLGLAACQHLVRNMGGELRVESALGTGTRFLFTLYLPEVESTVDRPGEAGHRVAASEARR